MDAKIRNVDKEAYRALKLRAAAEGKTIGEAVSEAIKVWASLRQPFAKRRRLFDMKPIDFGEGTEHLSDEIDAVVYGA